MIPVRNSSPPIPSQPSVGCARWSGRWWSAVSTPPPDAATLVGMSQDPSTLLQTALTTMQAYLARAEQTEAVLSEVLVEVAAMRSELAAANARLAERALSGWKEILPYLESLGRPMSRQHAAVVARRPIDPLPVRSADDGPVIARTSELREWVDRNAPKRKITEAPSQTRHGNLIILRRQPRERMSA